jgi:hypothetical protein
MSWLLVSQLLQQLHHGTRRDLLVIVLPDQGNAGRAKGRWEALSAGLRRQSGRTYGNLYPFRGRASMETWERI